MKIFDTHAHIGLIDEDAITQLIIAKEAQATGINAIVNICNNLQDFEPLYQNLHRADNIYFAVGISPSEISHTHVKWDEIIEEYARRNRVIAIGETGLDRKFGNKDQQIEFFIRHVEIAEKIKYPIIIHNREAGKEVLDVLSDIKPTIPVILHCYSEDYAYAEKVINILPDVFVSFTGSITYRTARHLREVASKIPDKHILVESESPFMIPANLKGKRNKPSYIIHTLKQLALLREMDEEKVAEIAYNNACRAFQITPYEKSGT